LLSRVLELRQDGSALAEEARVAAIMGRLVAPMEVYDYQPPQEIRAAYQKALGRSMAIFTVEGAATVPVKDRIAVAEALGRSGDPRFLPERDNMIELPGTDGVRLGKYLARVYRVRGEKGEDGAIFPG
jgi:hypothetical protein